MFYVAPHYGACHNLTFTAVGLDSRASPVRGTLLMGMVLGHLWECIAEVVVRPRPRNVYML